MSSEKDHDAFLPASLAESLKNRLGRLFSQFRAWVSSPWLVALFISLGVATALYLRYPGAFDRYTSQIPQDFGVYVKAWQRYMQGENPYVPTEFLAFKYAPGMLALIGVLPQAPTDAWFAFSTVCILGLALSLMIGARYRSWRDVIALVFGLALSWKGILECMDYGQVELFIFPILIIATSVYTRQTMLSGALIGMLPWIKLPLLFIVVPFLFASSRRDRDEIKPPMRRLKLFSSGFLLSSVFWGAALPSLAFGPDRALKLSQAWFQVLKTQPMNLFQSDMNQSLWASVGRWGADLHSPMAALGLAGVVCGLLIGLLVLRRPYTPTAQDGFVWITPWLIMGQLVNPLSWRWGSVYLIGVCFAAFRPGRRFMWFRGLLWVLAFLFFMLQQNPFVKGVLGLNHWTQLHELGVVTLYWLALLLLAI